MGLEDGRFRLPDLGGDLVVKRMQVGGGRVASLLVPGQLREHLIGRESARRPD